MRRGAVVIGMGAGGTAMKKDTKKAGTKGTAAKGKKARKAKAPRDPKPAQV